MLVYLDKKYHKKALSESDKKNIHDDVFKGKYSDFSKFKELFDTIDNIENIVD